MNSTVTTALIIAIVIWIIAASVSNANSPDLVTLKKAEWSCVHTHSKLVPAGKVFLPIEVCDTYQEHTGQTMTTKYYSRSFLTQLRSEIETSQRSNTTMKKAVAVAAPVAKEKTLKQLIAGAFPAKKKPGPKPKSVSPFKLEKNIPIKDFRIGRSKYPWAQMQVGDSFVSEGKAAVMPCDSYAHYKVITRKIGPNKFRIWRVK